MMRRKNNLIWVHTERPLSFVIITSNISLKGLGFPSFTFFHFRQTNKIIIWKLLWLFDEWIHNNNNSFMNREKKLWIPFRFSTLTLADFPLNVSLISKGACKNLYHSAFLDLILIRTSDAIHKCVKVNHIWVWYEFVHATCFTCRTFADISFREWFFQQMWLRFVFRVYLL